VRLGPTTAAATAAQTDAGAQAALGAGAMYDVILMSETLYEPAQYGALAALLLQLLRPETGVAYVCASLAPPVSHALGVTV
jgi:hypothetical protein